MLMMVPFETCRSYPASKPLQAIAFLSIVFYNTIHGPSIATVNKSKVNNLPTLVPFFSNGNKDFIQSDQQKRHIKMLQKLFKKKKKKKRQVTLEKPQAEQ